MSLLIVAGFLAGGLWMNGNARLDYKDTYRYKNVVGGLLDDAISLGYNNASRGLLEKEGRNVSYVIESISGGVWSNNAGAANLPEFYEQALRGVREGDYAHLIYLSGGILKEEVQTNHGYYAKETDLTRENSPYGGGFRSDEFGPGRPGTAISFVIAVRPEGMLLNTGGVYYAYYAWHRTASVMLVLAGICWAALLILLVTLVKHRSLGLAHRAIARTLGRVWVEVKLPALAAALVFLGWIGYETLDGQVGFAFGIAVTLGCFWAAWLLLTDLCVNRGAFFTRNIFTTVTGYWRRLESSYGFLKRMKRRMTAFLAAEALLAVCAVGFLLGTLRMLDGYEAELAVAFAVVTVLAVLLGVGLLAYFLGQYNRNMDEFGRVVGYADAIRHGTAAEPLALSGDFAELADNLNCIHSGISRAVEERVRSEQMKVELITNVSHDLKTPLTSIMNYVDLLGREELTPDYCNDYVRVLSQKAERLKTMIQDLFEISKANSGNIDLHIQRLDVVALVEQTLAELDERAGRAGVEVKTRFDVQRLMVYADGKMLHRVFENLLGNALKYSLAGTRVYISVQREEELAVVSFKNVSSYEMDFTAEEIVERFQRGDASRATEGSGLGLAIAKSFLELCGGSLGIELDGDLFKAVVRLPASDAPVPPAFPEEPDPALREDPASAEPAAPAQEAPAVPEAPAAPEESEKPEEPPYTVAAPPEGSAPSPEAPSQEEATP